MDLRSADEIEIILQTENTKQIEKKKPLYTFITWACSII